MAGLFSQAIVAFCIGTSGQYNEACNKAFDAGSRQIGLRQTVDAIEEETNRVVASKIGPDVAYVLGSSGFIYRAARNRSVSFHLPNFGIASSVDNEISYGSYKLNFKWNF